MMQHSQRWVDKKKKLNAAFIFDRWEYFNLIDFRFQTDVIAALKVFHDDTKTMGTLQ